MSDLISTLKNRYRNLNPLLFARSVERSTSPGELFDILEEIPQMPVVWDEATRRWISCDDILQSRSGLLRND